MVIGTRRTMLLKMSGRHTWLCLPQNVRSEHHLRNAPVRRDRDALCVGSSRGRVLPSAMRPIELIRVGLVGHRRVIRTVDRLPDDELVRPSLLPGWSRADVLAWLALKSRSHVELFDGARDGAVRSQFPEGFDQEAMIHNEVSKGAVALRSNLGSALQELEAAWEALPDHLWDSEGVTTAGSRSMKEVVARHLRDVEVHHVDLDFGYAPTDWPAEFVTVELAKRVRDLEHRTDPTALLAWLLGRRPAPELGPW